MRIQRLRPGHLPARRDDRHLQVGVERRALLPDRPDTRAVLGQLAAGLPVEGLPGAQDVVAPLERADLLVDVDDVRRHGAQLLAAHGQDAARRLARRQQLRVAVQQTGPQAAWADDVLEQLRSGGVAAETPGSPDADLVVWLTTGEPDRTRLDDDLAADRAHLVVSAIEGAVRVGPFVVPGRTACLRCVDAHAEEHDARRGLVLSQVAEQGVAPLPTAAALAAALAVRDVLAWADGDRPWTWSSTVLWGPQPAPVHHEWRRHPHCGCSWGDVLAVV